MAEWIILLFSFYGLLHGQGIRTPTEEECCQDGRNWAKTGPYCILPYLSYSHICRIAQEQCCVAAVKDRLCEKGIEMSKEPSACSRSSFQGEAWETQLSKTCCDCCMLGLVTASRGLSCELEGLMMGRKCMHTARDCCAKNTTVEIQPAAEIDLPTDHECCQNGRDWAKGGKHCANIELLLTPHTCRTAQEQCCAAAVEDRLCETGIEMAKDQWVCERPFFQGEPWETQLSKTCCDCCMLGLVRESRGSSCELKGLMMGRMCMHTARDCCAKNTTVEIQQIATAPVTEQPQRVVIPKPTEESEACIDSLCSQLCEGNGICKCLAGYELDHDGVTCQAPVTEQPQRVVSPKPTEGSDACIDSLCSQLCEGNGICKCLAGYELEHDGVTCKAPVTEQPQRVVSPKPTEGSDACIAPVTEQPQHTAADSLCSQLHQGNGICACLAGYQLEHDGVNCKDVNECVARTSSCPLGQTCINTLGSYTCRWPIVPCGRGYRPSQDGSRCEDVNECAIGNVCNGHSCLNLVGTFRCNCKTGYTFDNINKRCKDINECRQYSGRLCSHKCENTAGSYKCSCTAGFKLSYDKRNCQDVNECDANPCSHECANVYGSYQCYCRRGYQPSGTDGKTCEDIDECAVAGGGRVCPYRCANAPGSFYCSCPHRGYTLANNGRTCHDIDECANGRHTCSYAEKCFNIQGGFRCLTFRCPQNFQQGDHRFTDPSVLGSCVKNCQPKDTACIQNPVSYITYTSISLTTMREFNGPQEIAFLQTAAVAHNARQRHAMDVFFDILVADAQVSFDVVKRSYRGMVIGTVRLVKPIFGPKDIVLKVALNYVKSGDFSHRNIVVINVFVSRSWF
ncbi:fibulin-1-like [Pseudoliparis swirei]|uniref:fibulin-1-like n=1 Tax=Pseudoliparis swirei TaxID=2059687 RepID=UPI0024BD78A4|nr:fibulin-1-like [Pseudoliparis swirei]